MHKFFTAPTKSSGVRCAPPVLRSVALLNVLQRVRLRGPTRTGGYPSRVAQRTQVGAFVASLQETMHNPGYNETNFPAYLAAKPADLSSGRMQPGLCINSLLQRRNHPACVAHRLRSTLSASSTYCRGQPVADPNQRSGTLFRSYALDPIFGQTIPHIVVTHETC